MEKDNQNNITDQERQLRNIGLAIRDINRRAIRNSNIKLKVDKILFYIKGTCGYYSAANPPMVQITGDKLYKKHIIAPSWVTDPLLMRHVFNYERNKEIEIENGIVSLIWYIEDKDIVSRLLALRTQHRTNFIKTLAEDE